MKARSNIGNDLTIFIKICGFVCLMFIAMHVSASGQLTNSELKIWNTDSGHFKTYGNELKYLELIYRCDSYEPLLSLTKEITEMRTIHFISQCAGKNEAELSLGSIVVLPPFGFTSFLFLTGETWRIDNLKSNV